MKSREVAAGTPQRQPAASRDESQLPESSGRPRGPLQATIDRSPRGLAQLQSIEDSFGKAAQPMTDIAGSMQAPVQRRNVANRSGVRRELAAATVHATGPVAQRNPDEERLRADRYIVLIEHQIEQDYEELADDFDDPGFYRRLLTLLPPQRVIKIWEEGLVKQFIAEVAPVQEKRIQSQAYAQPLKSMLERGVDIETAQAALLFAFNYELPEEPGKAELALAARVALLFRHVSSVLASGVLSPAELRSRNIVHTPSSDTEAHDHISAFDIDHDRNEDEHYGERFPLPGHQSVSPMLERQNDIKQLAERMLSAARNANRIALEHLATMQRELKNTDPVEKFIETVAQSRQLMIWLGTLARFDTYGGLQSLANRAMNSAMVISSGTALASSGAAKYLKRPGLGPRVAELRAPTSIEPKDMTHVLLPDYMRGFPLLGRWNVPVVFVGTVITQVGYYDESSRVQQQLQLQIPNFQSAIDALVQQGTRKMLTHITNI